jgi:hypothetical protein
LFDDIQAQRITYFLVVFWTLEFNEQVKIKYKYKKLKKDKNQSYIFAYSTTRKCNFLQEPLSEICSRHGIYLHVSCLQDEQMASYPRQPTVLSRLHHIAVMIDNRGSK